MWACLEAVAMAAGAKEMRLSVAREAGQVLVRFAAEMDEAPSEPPPAVLEPVGGQVRALAGGDWSWYCLWPKEPRTTREGA